MLRNFVTLYVSSPHLRTTEKGNAANPTNFKALRRTIFISNIGLYQLPGNCLKIGLKMILSI